jgi:seryl-tRNA synthetase
VTEVEAYRQSLRASGLLIEGGAPGVYHRSGEFEEVVAGLGALVSAASRAAGPATRLRLSPVQPRAAVEASGYITSFPNLVGVISGFTGGEAQVPTIIDTVSSGADYTALLQPMELALCSAGCHGVYPLAANTTTPKEGLRFEIDAWCFRHEPSEDPARLQTFRMHEIVFVGRPDEAVAHRDTWLARGRKLLSDLELDVGVEVANDPFFGRSGRLLAANQREKELKYEIVAPISSQIPGAICSANYHETHFGDAYAITTPEGDVAHSSCIGFGLDRIVLSLALRHGFEPHQWPEWLRQRLGLESDRSR